MKTFPEIYCPLNNSLTYIPKIYGFKIYQKKGSKYVNNDKKLEAITFYGEENIKKMKG